MDKSIKLISRIIMALPIAIFGLFHLTNGHAVSAAVPAWLPGPMFWVYLTGTFHILYAIFAIGNIRYAAWFALIMAGLLFFYAFLIHLPGMLAAGKDQMKSMGEMINMLKDTVMGGGALYLFTELKKK